MAPTLKTLRPEYQLLYDSCLVRPARRADVNALAARVAASRARYEAVGAPLGIPWHVVGLLHAMESSLDFSTHLHNGDPLSARTTHWPEGRPEAGEPPFTWEESAADAVTGRGLHRWRDWSIPGTLFQLEAYNGFGYRNLAHPIPSPYLWSFSNHYRRGKFVADGRYSPTAVSQQCGAAVLLKRLAEAGAVQVAPSPGRPLQLANPHMTGPDVEEAQRLLTSNPFGDFEPGTIDGDFGELTAAAVKRAKWALGYPERALNATFGAALRRYLAGEKPLPPAFARRRAKRLAEAPAEDAVRRKIVEWALWGVKNAGRIGYSQGETRLAALHEPGSLPLATDCSAFATLCYAWANAPNPNHDGAYDVEAGGYTGTMLAHCRRIPQAAAKPGDLVVWTPPPAGQHVCVIVSDGPNPWLVSHGSDAGPSRIRFADEDAYQRRAGHGRAVFLSAF